MQPEPVPPDERHDLWPARPGSGACRGVRGIADPRGPAERTRPMARHRTLTIALPLLAAGALLAGGAASTPPAEAPRPAAGTLGGTAQTLTWSSAYRTRNYAEAVQFAAACTEGGFTDWRLPTVEELKAAVTDTDPDTFGLAANPSGSNRYWSSKKQGLYAFTVMVVSDAASYPIPGQSGAVVKIHTGSMLWFKCVRP